MCFRHHPVKWALVWTNMEAQIHSEVSIVDGGEAPRRGEFDGRAHAEGSLWRGWKLVPRKQRSDNMSQFGLSLTGSMMETKWVEETLRHVKLYKLWHFLGTLEGEKSSSLYADLAGEDRYFAMTWFQWYGATFCSKTLRATNIYVCIQATRHQVSQYAIRVTWSIQQRCRAIE